MNSTAIADAAESMLADLAPVHERAHALIVDDDVAPVSVQRQTANSKLAPQRVELAKSGRKRFVPTGPYCVSTYASIAATCPDSCRFKAGGCYAQAGQGHLTVGRLNRSATRWSKPWTPLEVTFAEAEMLSHLYEGGVPQDGAKGGRDVRLHVSGEVSCIRGARALAVEASRWGKRGGGVMWTFTHRWRDIPRRSWGEISALASCETSAEVQDARDRGYTPAMTVPRFPSKKTWTSAGVRFTACPFEAGKSTTCVTCRLCLDADRLHRRGLGIAFAVHGRDSEEARGKLPVL